MSRQVKTSTFDYALSRDETKRLDSNDSTDHRPVCEVPTPLADMDVKDRYFIFKSYLDSWQCRPGDGLLELSRSRRRREADREVVTLQRLLERS